MPTETKNKYGSQTQIPMEIHELANGALWQSSLIANTFIDAFVGGVIKTGSSPSSNGEIVLYVYGEVISGFYVGNVTGVNGSLAADDADKANFTSLGVIHTDAAADAQYPFGPFNVASAFGGNIPVNWGVIVENKTGDALNAEAESQLIYYQGIFLESTST